MAGFTPYSCNAYSKVDFLEHFPEVVLVARDKHRDRVFFRKNRMPILEKYSPAVRHTLEKLGADIRAARRRRGLSARLVAQYASTSRSTLDRIENGAGGVAIGVYAAVLSALGLLDHLNDLADPMDVQRLDPIDAQLERETLIPKSSCGASKLVKPTRPGRSPKRL